MCVIVLLVFHWSEVIVCLSYDVRVTDTTYHWVSSLGPLLRMKRNTVHEVFSFFINSKVISQHKYLDELLINLSSSQTV